jgi:hypothetical protein
MMILLTEILNTYKTIFCLITEKARAVFTTLYFLRNFLMGKISLSVCPRQALHALAQCYKAFYVPNLPMFVVRNKLECLSL